MKQLFALLLGATLALAACKKDDPLAGTFTGTSKAFSSGKAWTYVQNDDDGNPVEIGIILDEAGYNSLTGSGDIGVSLDFPTQASERTPILHGLFDYAPHGHEPAMVYDVPHFDLHYYFTTSAEREAITPFDTVKAKVVPAADYFPAAYFGTGLVPQMGVHWLDATTPELAGGSSAFTETFIHGSFDGKVTFWEPMITKAFIESKQSYEKAIKQPAKYQYPGKYYPTVQGFIHDTAKKEYRFYLKSFVKR